MGRRNSEDRKDEQRLSGERVNWLPDETWDHNVRSTKVHRGTKTKIDMNWDQYFLNIAEQVKEKSKDRRTKIGAVIVGKDNEIVIHRV